MRIHMPPSPGDPTPELTPRARAEVVLQLLSGQSIELLAEEIGVSAREIHAWCNTFVHAGFAALGGDQAPDAGPLAVQVEAEPEPTTPRPIIDGPPPVRRSLRRVA